MALYILVLLLVSFVTTMFCLALRKKKATLFWGTFSMLIFLWIFTSVPVLLGLKKTPFVKSLKVRVLTDKERKDKNIYNADGIIEFTSDKKLEKFDMERGNILRLLGANHSDFTYAETVSEGFITAIESNDIYMKEYNNGKYVYEAAFYIKNTLFELSDTIYCKIFMIQMFMPIHETNATSISSKELLEVLNKAGKD